VSRSGAANGLVRFLHRIGHLKDAPRTGWVDRGIPPAEAESVADHTFRTAVLAWLASAEIPGLDRDRVLKLALIHDLAESITGDIPPYDPDQLSAQAGENERRTFLNQRHVRDERRGAAKREAEAAAFADLIATLPAPLAEELDQLWRELERAETPEARFVKQADKIETYLQSREYLAADPSRPMASFAAEVRDVITIPILAQIRDAIPDLEKKWADAEPASASDPNSNQHADR
jgi:putative hydrolase of HD superfamily